jgi:LysM repeat protein
MAGRSPARFLAPLALVAFVIALLLVVSNSQTDPGGSGDPNRSTNSTSSEATPTATPERKGPRRYRVKPGDTPSSIAEKTGVPLDEILRLNPDLDPQTLAPGQRIKLRQ